MMIDSPLSLRQFAIEEGAALQLRYRRGEPEMQQL